MVLAAVNSVQGRASTAASTGRSATGGNNDNLSKLKAQVSLAVSFRLCGAAVAGRLLWGCSCGAALVGRLGCAEARDGCSPRLPVCNDHPYEQTSLQMGWLRGNGFVDHAREETLEQQALPCSKVVVEPMRSRGAPGEKET